MDNAMLKSELSDQTKANLLKNPLVIFGLIFLAGDGPLVILYSMTDDSMMKWVALSSTILFIFGMGAFFCYLVAMKPRNLYSPNEIPESAYDKTIYNENATAVRENFIEKVQEIAKDLSTKNDSKERERLSDSLNRNLQYVSIVQDAYEMLLIPGYDISLISEILEFVINNEKINEDTLAIPRHITSSTITVIVRTMIEKNLLEQKSNRYKVTDKGLNYLNGLRKYLRPDYEKT
jgi:predicted transcriptional regulator